MMSVLRLAGMVVALAFSLQVHAQTRYDKIEVGTVLNDGIGMGLFLKPLPLPQGEWLVVDKVDNSLGVNNTHVRGINSTPTISVVARNTAPDNPVVALFVSFLPNTTPLSYSNKKCEMGPSLFVDAVDTTEGGILYVCARAGASSLFQSFVAGAHLPGQMG